MNRVFKLFIVLILSVPALAQNSDSIKWQRFRNMFDNPYKPFKKALIYSFQYHNLTSANKISNDFIYPFVFKNNLSKKVIDDNLKSSKNRQLSIETNYETKITYLTKHLFNNKNISFYLKGNLHSRTYVNISDGAMKLIFRGNTDSKPYNFNNSSYYNLRMKEIGGGIYYHKEKTNKPFNLSVGLFVLKALKYGNINTHSNNYLQGNEDSFKVKLDYSAAFATSTNLSLQGMGLGSEVIFNQKISDNKTWGFKLDNFGFAHFNQNMSTYSSNGSYNFDGIYIPNIGRLGDNNYFQNQLDSFTNPLINKKENQSKTIWIAPVSFIYYNIHLKSGYYQFGVKHTGTKALPIAEFRYFKFIKSNLLFGVTTGFIGQHYLNTDISWAINQHWFFQAGISHLEALALPKTFGGLGGRYGLQFVF